MSDIKTDDYDPTLDYFANRENRDAFMRDTSDEQINEALAHVGIMVPTAPRIEELTLPYFPEGTKTGSIPTELKLDKNASHGIDCFFIMSQYSYRITANDGTEFYLSGIRINTNPDDSAPFLLVYRPDKAA